MKVNRKSLVWIAVAVMGIATTFTACKDVEVNGVTVNPTTKELVIGEKFQIIATVSPSDAADKSVRWNSEKPGIASVDNNGNVTAVAAGETIITCTTNDGGYKAETKITVVAEIVAVTGVTLPESMEIGVEQTQTITVTVLPDNATDKSVTWVSSNPEIAEINAEGNVTGKAEGEATITCTTNDGGFTATTKVNVVAEMPDYAEKIVGAYIGSIALAGLELKEDARIDVSYIQENRVELKMDEVLEVPLVGTLPINITCESDVNYIDGKYTIIASTIFPLNDEELHVDINGIFNDAGNVSLSIYVQELSVTVTFEGTRQ